MVLLLDDLVIQSSRFARKATEEYAKLVPELIA